MKASWALPLVEISGLARRHDDASGAQLVMVTDRGHIARARLSPVGGLSDVTSEPIEATEMGSDFEGVACNASRVFVLLERDACVLVFDAGDQQQTPGVIRLSIKADTARTTLGPGAQWFEDDNKRGEGLVLLRKGHVLIAKQRNPVCLIEFGPADDEPLGFTPGTALRDGDGFVLAGDDVTLDVLASWELDPASGVESINDLAVDAEGRLNLVSSKSCCVARLDSPMHASSGPLMWTAWPLPPELSANPEDGAEGLVFTPELGCLVALDHSRAEPNVFQVAGIPP